MFVGASMRCTPGTPARAYTTVFLASLARSLYADELLISNRNAKTAVFHRTEGKKKRLEGEEEIKEESES